MLWKATLKYGVFWVDMKSIYLYAIKNTWRQKKKNGENQFKSSLECLTEKLYFYIQITEEI